MIKKKSWLIEKVSKSARVLKALSINSYLQNIDSKHNIKTLDFECPWAVSKCIKDTKSFEIILFITMGFVVCFQKKMKYRFTDTGGKGA